MSIEFKKRSNAGRTLRRKEEDDDGETVAQESKTFDRIGTTQVSAIGASSIRQGKNDTSDSSASSNRISGASVTAVFESSRDVLPQQYSGGATHYNEIDTAADRDARAILERNVKLQEDASAATAGEGQGVYRGLGAYKSFTQKDSVAQISANKVTGTQGPIRAPAFLRAITRFDYQPDICKDYKETGYCGYGDSCKFLHDRGDYKSGWQQEREWDADQAKKKKRLEEAIAQLGDNVDAEAIEALTNSNTDGDDVDYSITEEEELPFACFICRSDFVNPVVTVCGHYFCSSCAIEENKKSAKCKVCGKQTFGVFNKAVKLIKKLQANAIIGDSPAAAAASKTTRRIGAGVVSIKLGASSNSKWEEVG